MILIAYIFIGFVALSHSQMPKKPPILPLTNDLPFIRCDVCQKSAKAIFKAVKNKREEFKTLKLGEEDILSIIEKSCNPEDEKYGTWIAKLDIVESKNELKLQDHTNIGKCREECKTIAKSCEETIGDIDTDLGELLWKNELKLSAFINKVCHSLSSACKANNKKFKKGKRKDFKFIEMTEKDIEAAKLMKNMKGMPGMPGMEMYTPEDLENMRDELGIDPNVKTPPTSNEPPSEKQQQKQKQHKSEETYQSSSLGFYDTVKAVGNDLIKKVKGVFGFNGKSEL